MNSTERTSWPPQPAPLGQRLDLAAFGEAMVMLQTPPSIQLQDAEHLTVHVAGAELNACAAVVSCGGRAALVSAVGDDALGRRVVLATAELGVGDDLISVDAEHPTGLYFKEMRPVDEREVTYYRKGSAASAMGEESAAAAFAAQPRAVLTSGITAAIGPGPRRLVTHVLRTARTRGIATVFDPNLRPALGAVADQAATWLGLLKDVDLLVLGLDEAEAMFATTQPDRVVESARQHGAEEIVLKAGSAGCWVESEGTVEQLDATQVTVVDPVGAGDAFAGGYIAVRLAGGDQTRAGWLGNQLAGRVVATAGDNEGLPDIATGAALLDHALQAPLGSLTS